MAEKIFISIEGDKALMRKLRNLETRVQKRVLQSALRKCCKIIADKARQLVPKLTGTLRKSIKVRAMKRSRTRTAGMMVTTGAGDNLFAGKQYYGGMIEYGTKKMGARPFMRPAVEQTQGEVNKTFETELAAGIQREAMRA